MGNQVPKEDGAAVVRLEDYRRTHDDHDFLNVVLTLISLARTAAEELPGGLVFTKHEAEALEILGVKVR